MIAALCGCPGASAETLHEAVDRDYRENLEELLFYFHQNQELSFLEVETALRMAGVLREIGYCLSTTVSEQFSTTSPLPGCQCHSMTPSHAATWIDDASPGARRYQTNTTQYLKETGDGGRTRLGQLGRTSSRCGRKRRSNPGRRIRTSRRNKGPRWVRAVYENQLI